MLRLGLETRQLWACGLGIWVLITVVLGNGLPPKVECSIKGSDSSYHKHASWYSFVQTRRFGPGKDCRRYDNSQVVRPSLNDLPVGCALSLVPVYFEICK